MQRPLFCFCKRFFTDLTPWKILQLAGFFLLAAFTIGTYFSRFTAQAETIQQHEQRLTTLETHYDKMDQKLDDMIYYFKIPHHQERKIP